MENSLKEINLYTYTYNHDTNINIDCEKSGKIDVPELFEILFINLERERVG